MLPGPVDTGVDALPHLPVDPFRQVFLPVPRPCGSRLGSAAGLSLLRGNESSHWNLIVAGGNMSVGNSTFRLAVAVCTNVVYKYKYILARIDFHHKRSIGWVIERGTRRGKHGEPLHIRCRKQRTGAPTTGPPRRSSPDAPRSGCIRGSATTHWLTFPKLMIHSLVLSLYRHRRRDGRGECGDRGSSRHGVPLDQPHLTRMRQSLLWRGLPASG